MRTRILTVSAAAFLCGFLWIGQAWSQDAYPQIPSSLSQIQDGLLRDSLAIYSPGYDSLPRSSQLTAYANIYRVLYNQDLGVPAPAVQYAPPVTYTSRPYDPRIDVPVYPYPDDPLRYSRYWDASRDGGTGRYEPWRDPMWTPWEEVGSFVF